MELAVSGIIQLRVKTQRRSDQSKVGKGLRKIAEVLALDAKLFGIKPKVISVTQHFFEDEPRFV
jgi:hypothetical protein